MTEKGILHWCCKVTCLLSMLGSTNRAEQDTMWLCRIKFTGEYPRRSMLFVFFIIFLFFSFYNKPLHARLPYGKPYLNRTYSPRREYGTWKEEIIYNRIPRISLSSQRDPGHSSRTTRIEVCFENDFVPLCSCHAAPQPPHNESYAETPKDNSFWITL